MPRRIDPVAEPEMLGAMDAVMQAAYGVTSFRAGIERFAAAQPDGLVVAEDDGRVVGTGCCVAYPEGGFGWIGLVATCPGFERRGIATAITESLSAVLASHGVAPVLDASTAGAPVYQRLGFIDHGLTRVLAHDGRSLDGAVETVSIAGLDDFADLVHYDAQRFGAPRSALLRTAIAQQPDRAMVVRRGGAVVGYVIAHEATLGPLVADDPDAVSALLAAALMLEFEAPVRVNVPPDSEHLATLLALGFTEHRVLRHMRQGIETLPGRRSAVAGELSLGEG